VRQVREGDRRVRQVREGDRRVRRERQASVARETGKGERGEDKSGLTCLLTLKSLIIVLSSKPTEPDLISKIS
jgi:hypothetical protein